jgi:NAD(P)-dependent dehydrogenase (short-subunit alcohol dehydrogenase family)
MPDQQRGHGALLRTRRTRKCDVDPARSEREPNTLHMREFADGIAVVTGGGTGIGRELVRQLVAEGCHVALCDLSAKAMAKTKRLCEKGLPQGRRITTHVADVADESQVQRFRAEVAEQHATDRIHLLFNNAGVGGGGSMFADSRESWERTFNICWGGVYLCTRAFLPMLQEADQAHIVNISSVNGFWASVGPGIPHTAYSAAKFAVKGFTEALIADLQVHAPHIKCSVIMPGHIGTSILLNSRKILTGIDSGALTPAEMAQMRERAAAAGMDTGAMSDASLQALAVERVRRFIDDAPTTAAEAATIILTGVKAARWRILAGEDAHRLDELVRQSPERAYEIDFFQDFVAESCWSLGVRHP